MTNLHDKIETQKTWIVILIALVIGIASLLVTTQARIHGLRDVQIGMVNAAHRQHVAIENLCAAVSDQEHIIRRELPLVRMSWTAQTEEICRDKP